MGDAKGRNKEQLDYTEDVVLMYYSKSKDVEPGKGTGEKLLLRRSEEEEDEEERDNSNNSNNNIGFKYGNLYELSKIPNWRQRLSNFDESPFYLDGHNWKSVEHYFQAQKFINKAPWHYKSFTIESKSILSQSLGGPVKKAGGKSIVELTKEERHEWEKMKHIKMKHALWAKYTQHDDLSQILLYTGNAKLTHKPTRSKYTFVEYDLMFVRYKLQIEKGIIIIQENDDGRGTNEEEEEDDDDEDINDERKVSAAKEEQISVNNNNIAAKTESDEDENQTISLRQITNDVEGMKLKLSKFLHTKNDDDDDVTTYLLSSPSEVEQCQDIFQQLFNLSDNTNSNESILIGVLTKTMIGQVISKFKQNPIVGPTAKILIKKWKLIYRRQQHHK